MNLSPKMKWGLAFSGGVALALVSALLISRCTDKSESERVVCDARMDSLRNEIRIRDERSVEFMHLAAARGDTINAMRQEYSRMNDSLVVLNDSVVTLDSLLNDCRGKRSAQVAKKKVRAAKKSGPVKNNGVSSHGKRQVTATATPGCITINGGSNNSVNINNGVINNYYGAQPQPVRKDSVHIKASASVQQTVVVKVRRIHSR